jgi:hypothetical protein
MTMGARSGGLTLAVRENPIFWFKTAGVARRTATRANGADAARPSIAGEIRK